VNKSINYTGPVPQPDRSRVFFTAKIMIHTSLAGGQFIGNGQTAAHRLNIAGWRIGSASTSRSRLDTIMTNGRSVSSLRRIVKSFARSMGTKPVARHFHDPDFQRRAGNG
jgi:hypothetical protein